MNQTTPTHLAGIEFDWFALDDRGNLALFATAGEGFLPTSVIEHHMHHAAIAESLPAPRTGTTAVWHDYAALGLYVYDWDLPGGPYILRAAPTSAIAHPLKRDMLSIPALPRIDIDFAAHATLAQWS